MSGELLVMFVVVVVLAVAPAVAQRGDGEGCDVYVGTYTGAGGSRGIYVVRLNLDDGSLHDVRLAAEAENPSFLAVHPAGRFVYAVNEVSKFQGEADTGGVTAFERDAATGLLREVDRAPSGGAGPCFVTCDATGRFVLLANYGGGSIKSLLRAEDGRFDEASAFAQFDDSGPRQPRAHCIMTSPDNRFVLATDLGRDQVLVLPFEAEFGALPIDRPVVHQADAGTGPRHLAFHPGGRAVYVIHEHTSTLAAYRYDPATGQLQHRQTVGTLPAAPRFTGRNTTAHVLVHPSGRFLYGSNRGHDSLAIFRIDEGSGQLQLVGHEPSGGRTPRHFTIDRSGRWLLAANQDGGGVVSFAVDPSSGRLARVGQAEVSKPVCVQFAR